MNRIVIILFILLILPLAVFAQTVTNVSAEQVGKNIDVHYQLDKAASISIEYSTDGGNTYRSMSHTSGDVGKNIAAGQRSITWDVLADVEKLVCGDLVFKVTPYAGKMVASNDGKKLIFTINGVSFTMIKIEGGTFTMGATLEQRNDADSNEKPTHTVSLSTYFLGETEVTQALWIAVMGKSVTQIANENGWRTCGVGDNYPMYYISYDDCKTFISKLNSLLSSQLGGKRFALPTEAQWEYAARGGKKSQGYKYSGRNSLDAVGWHAGNSSLLCHPVKTKQSNELGLYDMSGNVWEWCQDWYGSYSRSSQVDPQGYSSGANKVYRGGSWHSYGTGLCRVSARSCNAPSTHYGYLGLRLCLLP